MNGSSRHAVPWTPLAIGTLLIAGISAGAFLNLQGMRRAELKKQAALLQEIAGLKVEEIENWIRERRGDARLIMHSDTLAVNLSAALRPQPQPSLLQSVRHWMKAVQESYRYENVLLLDRRGRTVAAAHDDHAQLGAEGQEALERSRQRRDVTMTDLHTSPQMPHIHMGVLAPILAGEDIPGFILLRIDPERFLFPLIQRWPTASATAETLLVRREGDAVLFLNDLRHRPGTAMTLRLPLRGALPAAQAIWGRVGFFAGRDYRGTRVWSVMRPVQGTAWFMVAKVDEAEIMAPLVRQTRRVLLPSLALILSAAAGMLFLWQRQAARQRLSRLAAENERLALVKHFDYLSRHANDIILLSDPEHHILEANERAVQVYGYSREELLQKGVVELRTPEERPLLDAHYQESRVRDGAIFETVHQRRDGSAFPVEVSARVIHQDGREYFQSICRDISERREAEARLRHATRLYAVLSQINQAIVRAKDRQRLFQDICDVAVRYGDLHRAWIGLLAGNSRTVEPAFWAGHTPGGRETAPLALEDARGDGNPAWTAVAENRLTVCNDVAGAPSAAAWRDEALAEGSLSLAALPLRNRGACIGVLALHSSEADFFDPSVVGLLEEVAADIAYALDAMDMETERRRAEERLRSEKQFSEALLAAVPDIIMKVDNNKVYRWANPAGIEFFGDDVIGRAASQFFIGEQDTYRLVQPLFDGRAKEVYLESWQRRRDGEARLLAWKCRALTDAAGGTAGALSSCRDITDIHCAEEALRESERRFKEVFETANVGKSLTLPDGEVVPNQAFCEMLGYSGEELRQLRWQEITPGEEIAAIEKILEPLRNGTQSAARFSKRYLRKDGSTIWGDVSVTLRRDAQGKPLHFITTVIDISERVRAEEALRASESKFRETVATLDEGYYSVTLEGTLLDHNRAFCRILGFADQDDLRGARLPDFWRRPEERSRYIQALQAAGSISNYQIEAKRRDGGFITVLASSHLVRDEGGRVQRIQGVFLDISERIRREEELQSLTQQLQVRNRIAEIALTVPDEDFFHEILAVVLGITGSRFGVFGYIDEEGALVVPTMTRDIWSQCQVPEKDIVFPRCQWGDSIWPTSLRQKRALFSNQPSLKIPAGHVPVQRNISLPILHGGEPIGLFQVANKETDYGPGDIRLLETIAEFIAPLLNARLQRDRHERLRRKAEGEIRRLNQELEERVRQRTAQLEAANKELEAFSYSVSHDLRAPLRAISGFSRILAEESAARLDREGRRVLGVIVGNTEKMGRLIDDLLAFSRLSRQAIQHAGVDLSALAREVFAELRTQDKSRKIKWLAGPSPPAAGDPSMLRQVLHNLLANAVKFTRGRKQARIEFGGREEKDGNVYFVKDNGAGFDPEYKDKLFGIFQRLHSSSEFEGTGVGLAIVQRIVARHGGRVWAESRLGKGATFYFQLPRDGGEHEAKERS